MLKLFSGSASRRPHVNRVAIAAVALAFVAGMAAAPRAAAAGDLPGSFRGNAYGTEANAKSGDVAVGLGRSAYLPCPCRGTNGRTLSNEITSLKARNVLSAAVVKDTILTKRDATHAVSTTTSTISNLNMFDGLLTATTIKGVASVNATKTALSGSTSGSTFGNLKVAGKAVSANIAANSTINLAGIGKLTLKKVTTSKNSSRYDTIVDMLVIDVTVKNKFDLPVGAQIVVGHAYGGYIRTGTASAVGGQAYVTDANTAVGRDLQNRIGRAAFVSFSCDGTNGKTRTNNVAGLGIDRLVRIGSGNTTAMGGPTSTGAYAKTTAKVQSLNLLNGLITASVVTASAEESLVNGRQTRSTKGTGFVGLTVLGIRVPANVPANTKIVLPNLGYLILNEQIVPTSGGQTEVNGLHVKVSSNNALKLPVKSEIIIAHAHAFARK